MVIVWALLAPLLSPYNPTEQQLENRFHAPTSRYVFGTDDFGRDIYTRVLYGGRPTLAAGVVSVSLALVVGVIVGMAAGFWGGILDDILMRSADVMLAFPAMLLAILIVATLGPGVLNEIVAIAVSQIPMFARMARSVVISIARTAYVEAARAAGAGDPRILVRHVLPNLTGTMIVVGTVNLAMAIGYAAAFGFLGLGVQPPTPDWGNMVSDGARYLYDHPYIAFFPGAAITLTVVSLNFVGDAVRDYLDPTMRRLV
jgi:peptide/nickel transport system permease protein